MSDYLKYRGKCKELAEEATVSDSTLRLVRGYYHCPLWGQQQHWWCVNQQGKIIDPSIKQFPTNGAGATYEEYDGSIVCEYCGDSALEAEAYFVDHHCYCSATCYARDVGF